MKFGIIILFFIKISEIICDLYGSVDPIDTEYYQTVVLNRTVKQETDGNRNGRIVGGLPAVLGQFEYFVIVYGENRRYLCGGTLIKPSWVMTVGHCLYKISNVEVHFGIVNRLASPERIVKIEDDGHLIVHEGFDLGELVNDIALIYLEKMSSLWLESSSIGFIEPKIYDLNLTGQTATVCGFGKTSDYGGASYTLNYINIPIMDYKECEYYFYLDENNICVDTKSGKSPCNGDSGGGVVITTKDNQRILIGIVSFGTTLCTIHTPTVLTKVSNYIEWMEDKFSYFESLTTADPESTKSVSSTPSNSITSTTPNSVKSTLMDRQVVFVIMTVIGLILMWF